MRMISYGMAATRPDVALPKVYDIPRDTVDLKMNLRSLFFSLLMRQFTRPNLLLLLEFLHENNISCNYFCT